MALHHLSIPANDVRAPEVPRGETRIVSRYGNKAQAKVALVNPEDLAMLEECYDAVVAASQLRGPEIDDLTRKTIALEDRPSPEGSIEDAAQIKALLGL